MLNFETLLNIKINKIYCISLESRIDRREYLKTQFKKLDHKIHFNIVKKNLDPIKGCLESHIECIREANKLNFENILIFEDDILINEKVLNNIKNVYIPENFDMFYLGYHINNGIRYGKNILKILSGQTTHAYIINKRVFNYILNNINKDWDNISNWSIKNKYEKLTNYNVRAIDLFYSKWVHEIRNKTYGIYPILIYQKPDFSDIENRNIDYRNLMETKANEFYKKKIYNYEIWLLNLERRKDRLLKMKEKTKEYDLEIYRINAVDGLKFNFENYLELFSLRDFKLRNKNPYKHHENNKGILGCALSHYKMWEKISKNVKLNNEDYVLIIEDDCYFIDNFETKLNLLLDELKYKLWDICFIGYTDYKPLDNDEKNGNNLIKLCGDIRTRGGGTFGYLITKNGAKKYYELANDRCIQQPIDWFMIEQYDKLNVYKTYKDLIFSNIAGKGNDSDIQNILKPIYDINLKIYNFNNIICLKDQYNNLFTLNNIFSLNYLGILNNNKINIKPFYQEIIKTQLSTALNYNHNNNNKINIEIIKNTEYIALYAGNKMKIFIHYFAKYLKIKLQKNVVIFYNGFDLIFDDMQYINMNKFDKLNNIAKYSQVFLFDIVMFLSNYIKKWNKITIFEDGELFFDNKYKNNSLPDFGLHLFKNLLNKVDNIIGISKTNIDYFKILTGIVDNIPILPPVFFENNIFTDHLDLNKNDILFISYDNDINAIIKFYNLLKIKNKKLLIFSDIVKSNNKDIIIKKILYKFNFSYLNIGKFYITQSKLTDSYYTLNLSYNKGLVCIIPEYYKEFKNKVITFKENLNETIDKVQSFINIPKKFNIYKNITKKDSIIMNTKLSKFKLFI